MLLLYDKRFLNIESIPVFCKDILLSFLGLKSLYHTHFGQDLVLFNNKEILIEGKTFFFKNWYQKRVICIQDLLNNDGHLLSIQEFQYKYNIKCNFLQYSQKVSAIPKQLLVKARGVAIDKRQFLICETVFNLSSTAKIDLLRLKCKDYNYWLLIRSTPQEIKAASKWQQDLSLNELILRN